MSKTTAGYLTGMTTNARTPLMLAAMVALRVDNMGDTCPAWIASAERRCGKPATDGHLCARHHQVAVRRWDARTAAEVADDPAAYQAWWADTCRAASARDWTPPPALEAGRHDARPAITALADVWTPETDR